MRLITVIAVAVVSTTLLAGCFGQANSKKPWMVHDQKCEQLGFKRGTAEHVNCRLELARQATPRGGAPAAPD
jgi:outer membrane murein-binding lipoprotein Lpp